MGLAKGCSQSELEFRCWVMWVIRGKRNKVILGGRAREAGVLAEQAVIQCPCVWSGWVGVDGAVG